MASEIGEPGAIAFDVRSWKRPNRARDRRQSQILFTGYLSPESGNRVVLIPTQIDCLTLLAKSQKGKTRDAGWCMVVLRRPLTPTLSPFPRGEGVVEPHMLPLSPHRGERAGVRGESGFPPSNSAWNLSNGTGNPERRPAHLGGLPLSLLRWKLSRPHELSDKASNGLLPFLYFLILNAVTTHHSEVAFLRIQQVIDKYYQDQFGLSADQAWRLAEDLVYVESKSFGWVSNGMDGFLVFGLLFTAGRWVWVAQRQGSRNKRGVRPVPTCSPGTESAPE